MSPHIRTGHEVRLCSRPRGDAVAENSEFAEVEVPPLASGRVLVRNPWMLVDPYMRGRMDEAEPYIPPFALGEVLEGGAIGEVIALKTPSIPVGAMEADSAGWRTHAVLDAPSVRQIDTGLASSEHYLGVLGTTGLTVRLAWQLARRPAWTPRPPPRARRDQHRQAGRERLLRSAAAARLR